MEVQTLQAKQQYLYKEILDQDYDPEEFQEFLAHEKGLELDDYSMKELIQAVRKFKGVLLEEPSSLVAVEDSNQPEIAQESRQKPSEPNQSSAQTLENQHKAQNLQQTKNTAVQHPQKNPEISKSPKIKIDLKKMIIPQYKSKDSSNSQQPNSQKSPTRAHQIFGTQKEKSEQTQKAQKNSEAIIALAPKPVRKNLYKEDQEQENEEKQVFGGFIGDPDMKPDVSFSEYNHNESLRQSQNVKQSIYIPSENNKNPYILVKKPNLSSLYKDMKSFVKDPKDSKKINPFFEGFSIMIREFSKKQSNSIFRFPYVTYNIQTTIPISKEAQNKALKPQSQVVTNKVWKVERRFNDFKWIHEFLSKSYYGLPIPPIPLKTKMRSFNDEHLSQRMNVFERFLNKCSHIDEICSDPIFEAFLSIESREELEAVKKKFDNKIKSRDQNIMEFLKGDQILMHAKEQSQISANTKIFLTKETQLLQLLNRELQSVQRSIKEASEHAVFASNIFRELSQLYKANHEYEINGSGFLDLTNEYISELSYKLDNQAYYLKNYVSDLWVYEEMYNKNLIYRTQSLDRHKNVLQTKFRDFHHVGKSSELIEEPMNTSSNTKGSALYKKTRQLYEINLSLCIEEMSRHLKQDLLITAKYFLKGMEKHVRQVKEEMMTGVDLMTKIMTVSEGKELKEVELIGSGLKDRLKEAKMKEA